MKRVLLALIVLTGLMTTELLAQDNMGIGTSTPEPSAVLDLDATDKGFLVPRLNTAQRNAVAAPATGLMVYDTDDNKFWYFDGTVWVQSVGPAGPAGADGADGVDGQDGAQGPAGPQGLPGADGADGQDGADGVDGQDGAQGPAGPAGPQGLPGADGVDGQDGAQGPAGPQGLPGADGADGQDGADGVDGQDGAQGPAGPQGLPGADGADGQDGADGVDGQDGAQGPAGPQGLPGADGAQGPAGPVGCTDPNIIVKSDGTAAVCSQIYDDGVSVGIGTTTVTANNNLTISGNTSQIKLEGNNVGSEIFLTAPSTTATGGVGTGTSHDLPLFTNGVDRVTIKNTGEVGIGTAAPTEQLHSTSGVRFEGLPGTGDFVGIDGVGVLSRVSAASGPAGPAGPQGLPGADGADGQDGADGVDGQDGAQGPAGPAGPQGLPGADGADGQDGADGVDGQDGAQGPAGPAGPQGLPGADGVDGQDGAQGLAGPVGPQGLPGADGADGQDGAQGPAGADGADGADGAQGPAGADGADGADGATGPAGPVGCATANIVVKSNGTTAVCSQIFDDGIRVAVASTTPAADNIFSSYATGLNLAVSGYGVDALGTYGVSTGWIGSYGIGAEVGVYGAYDGLVIADNNGVEGFSYPAAIWGIGVEGTGGWYGVRGEAIDGFAGVYGSDNVGGATYAVYANGDFGGNGLKYFVIDHPLDPENKTLKHFNTESDEPLLFYRGKINLDENGEAVIELPAYVAAVNRDFTYNVTPMGPTSQVYVSKEFNGNSFSVAGGTPGVKISWMLTGTRNDEYVKQNPEKLEVEVEKTGKIAGKYLRPELYGADQSKSALEHGKENKAIKGLSKSDRSNK